MNLVQIKQKYREILQQPDSQHSQQWEAIYSRIKNKKRHRTLTQSNYPNIQTKQLIDQNSFLKLKEKLAQCITNISRKDNQISQLKHINVKYVEKITELEDKISELKKALSNQQQNMIKNKIAYGCIEKDRSSLSKVIESNRIDKELMKKQIEYFEQQTKEYQKKLMRKDAEIQEIKIMMQKHEKYKSVNCRLKIDISRLKQLLAQTDKYRIFASQIQNKHYLGQNCREHQCWFSQQLIGEVEKFIKKHKIGSSVYNFKNLMSIFVKFISKYTENQKKKIQKQAKRTFDSKIKQIQRKQNHSMKYIQVRGQTLKKSHLGKSLCRSIKNHTQESKKCTQSFIYDKLEKSLATHDLNQNRDLCIEVLRSFRKGIIQLIYKKKKNSKKLLKLLDWAIEGILSIFPNQRITNEIRLDTDQIKIVQ